MASKVCSSMSRALVFVLAALLVASCAPAPGEQVAARIRAAGSPLVREVTFRAADMIDPASIDVFLSPGTTRAQAEGLWCAVIVPAGGTMTEGDAGVALWTTTQAWTAPAGDGSDFLDIDPTCP